MLLRNRMLMGGVSFLPLFDADKGGGAGGGAGAGTGAGDGAGQGAGGAAAGAAAAAPGSGVAGAAPGDGSAAGAGASGAGKAAGAPGDGTLAGGAADTNAAAAAAAAAAAGAAGAAGKLPDGFDFRAYLANGDKDAERDLAKYTDPRAVYKSLRQLQADISSGKLKAPAQALPENATPEQKAEWRKSNSLPDKPEAYVEKLALPDGVVIGDADKPLVGEFAKMAFDKGWSQPQMNDAVSWYYQLQDTQQAELAERDGQSIVEAQGALIGEWGQADFKVNMNAVGSLQATMPKDFKDALLTARTPDGRLIGNTTEYIRWAAQTARELNPAATLIPNLGGDSGKTIGDEIAAIEKSMYDASGQPAASYWKGSEGEAKQARYRELISARDKMAAKGKAA